MELSTRRLRLPPESWGVATGSQRSMQHVLQASIFFFHVINMKQFLTLLGRRKNQCVRYRTDGKGGFCLCTAQVLTGGRCGSAAYARLGRTPVAEWTGGLMAEALKASDTERARIVLLPPYFDHHPEQLQRRLASKLCIARTFAEECLDRCINKGRAYVRHVPSRRFGGRLTSHEFTEELPFLFESISSLLVLLQWARKDCIATLQAVAAVPSDRSPGGSRRGV
jgi:hypothetical protein